MKILITNPSLIHAGAERVISILSNSLVEHGHEVELLLYYDQPISYKLDSRVKVTVDEKIIEKSGKLKHLFWRRKYLKNCECDVVISFLAPFNVFNIIAMFGLKKKLIVADRNDPRRIPTNKIMRCVRDFLYRFADGVVLQNSRNRDYFSKSIRKKSTVIFNPVDLGEYIGASLKCEKHEKRKEIVSVGRIIKQKNPHMLLNAFSRLADDFPEYKLAFIGDGDLRDEIKKAAEEKGLGDRVELNGVTNQVFERIHKSELYVMSSEYEGMPNALIEAMCIGLPVISTKVSGATDVIEDGVNGLFVDCNDEEALEQAIRKMLSDEELRNNCGANASKISEQLKVEAITEQWINFIEKVIKK
jgi:glycosyltransferase involved in cell wall biosynthesis